VGARKQQEDLPVNQLEKQVGHVLAAIRAKPARRKQILSVYMVNFFGAVKETIRRQGRIMSFYVIMADPVDFGIPPVTGEVTSRAKEMNAEALVWVEGFQSVRDISDVIYHVALSAPSLGVVGWVLKVKLSDGRVEFTREMPYHFQSPETAKTLGELVEMVEGQ
jgi:hypothetical protein